MCTAIAATAAAPTPISAFPAPATRVWVYGEAPNKVKIDEGAVHMCLTGKGILRWCPCFCDTQLFNIMATPRLPFACALTDRLETAEPLGPTIAEGFVEGADGKSRHVHGGRVVGRFLRRTVAARLSGRWKETPFFNPAKGAPVAEIERPASDT